MPLPAVPEDAYRSWQVQTFRRNTDNQIGVLDWQADTDQQIAQLGYAADDLYQAPAMAMPAQRAIVTPQATEQQGQPLRATENGWEAVEAPIAPPRGAVESGRASNEPMAGPSANPLVDYARSEAAKNGIDPDLFVKQLDTENGFRTTGESAAGARGIAQIVPKYHPGVNVDDPYESIAYAAKLMASHLKQYNGDQRKALVAYNGGGGAVAQYEKGAPYEESQAYLDKIMGGSSPTARDPESSIAKPRDAVDLTPNQFGDSSLTADEAMAACGPAAAVAFARANGRNPSLKEALDLAKQVGWTADGGMNGVQNQKRLLDRMGIESELADTADWGRIRSTAQAGSPVAISTNNHYFVADDYNPETGQYHVGASGTAYRNGAEWMTAEQIAQIGGGVNGALYTKGNATGSLHANDFGSFADRMISDATGTRDMSTAPIQDDVPSYQREYAQQNGSQVADNPYVGMVPTTRRTQTVGDVAGQVGGAIARPGALLPNVGEAARSVGLGGLTDEDIKLAEGSVQKQLSGQALTPEEEKALQSYTGFVGGMTGAQFGGKIGATTRAPAASRRILEEHAQPITSTREAEVARLKLDDFPEWMHDDLVKAAEGADFHRAQRRGVIPLDTQDDLGRVLAESTDIDTLIAGSKAGKAFNTEQIRAYKNLVGSQAATVTQLSRQVAEAKGNGTVTDKLLAEAFAEGERLQGLQRILEGGRAEWGRAGQAFQAPSRLLELSPTDATARIFNKVGNRENAIKAVDEFAKLTETGATPIQMANFWAKVDKPPPNAEEWFRALRYNSMLSGPRTAEVNIGSGFMEIPWRLARDTAASTLRGRPEEMVPEFAGAWHGLLRGNRAFMETLSQGITTERALAGDLPTSLANRVQNPAAKAAAHALDAPSRLLSASDEWMHAVAYGMSEGRQAGLAASKTGARGKQWDTAVAEFLADVPAGIKKDSLAVAERMTYKGEMGTLGRALQGVQKVPYLGSVLIPFLKTVYHITSRGIDRSPLGAVGTAIDLSRGVYGTSLREVKANLSAPTRELPHGVVPLGERAGDNLIGTMATLAFYKAAVEDNVSGAGPDDPEKRDLLRAQGWQPYSVRIGGNWVSYSNWGPVAIPLSMAAGIAEAQKYAKPADGGLQIAADAFRRTSEIATEQAYLQGIGAVWKGIDDPKRYGSQWLSQFMTSLVPYGAAINTLGQATDDTMRRPDRLDMGDALSARFPGLRASLPAAQDQFGRDIPNQQTGISALNPLRVSPTQDRPAAKELLAFGVDVSDAPKAVSRNGISIELTPEEQRQFASKSGALIEKWIAEDTQTADYKRMLPEGKRRWLQRNVERAREMAGTELFNTIPIEDFNRRRDEGALKKAPLTIR